MLFAAMGGEMRSFFGIGVGTAVAVIAYVGKVFDPLESIGMEIQNIQSAVAGVRRINEFLAEPEWAPAAPGEVDETADPAAAGCTADAGAAFIRFSQVRFCYGDGPDVLQDLSFSVRRGEAVIFVGRTGAGKSTVFRLLMGLYRPQSGSIRIGGRPADCVPARERRRLFGYVEQAFRLVDGTVAEQISLFDPDIGQAQIEAAAKLVGLHDTILALPQGYGTPAADVSFSQGQFQLLSIARAVAASPQILLLDEITANLDSGTERRVLDALDRAAAGRTVLSISHRVQAGIGQRQIRIGGDAAAADA
jgi:ATP-binding cassette subfamily B multidrug efflux pump